MTATGRSRWGRGTTASVAHGDRRGGRSCCWHDQDYPWISVVRDGRDRHGGQPPRHGRNRGKHGHGRGSMAAVSAGTATTSAVAITTTAAAAAMQPRQQPRFSGHIRNNHCGADLSRGRGDCANAIMVNGYSDILETEHTVLCGICTSSYVEITRTKQL